MDVSTCGGQVQSTIAPNIVGRGLSNARDLNAKVTTSDPSRECIVGPFVYLLAPAYVMAQKSKGDCLYTSLGRSGSLNSPSR